MQDQDRAAPGGDHRRQPRHQVARSVAAHRQLEGLGRPAGQHLAELLGDAGMADRLDVRSPGGVALHPQHPARRLVHHLQLAGLVDDQHALDHAAEDGLHARPIARQRVDAASLLLHRGVERARRHAEVVVAVVGTRPRQVAQRVAPADVGDRPGPGPMSRRQRRRADDGDEGAEAGGQADHRHAHARRDPHEEQRRRRGADRGDQNRPAEVEAHGSSQVDQRRERRRRHRRRRVEQLVAELLDGDERLGQEGQLLAQPPHVDVDGARAAGVGVVPHVGQQQVARQHPAAMLQQVLEQQELLGGEPHVLAVGLDDVPIDVDAERAVGERAARRCRALRPAQQRPHAGHDFARAEGLGDVVVGAELQPDDAVRLLGLGGEHDHRHGGGRRIGAHRPAHVEAVHARQHHVEDHQIGRRAAQPRQHVASRVGDVDGVGGFFEVVADQRRDVGVVLGHEDAAHAAESIRCGRVTAGRCRRGVVAGAARRPATAAPAG